MPQLLRKQESNTKQAPPAFFSSAYFKIFIMKNISLQNKIYDVLIIGSGLAGVYAALQFPSHVKVLLISKFSHEISSSNLAQGGIAAVLDLEEDSFVLHSQDTVIAGGHENNLEAVDVLVREGPSDVRKIIEYGVEFDRNEQGLFDKTLEGGHSRRRILHYKDSTGMEMLRKLVARLKLNKNVTIKEDARLYSLTRINSGFRADLLTEKGAESVFASYAILCTGGIGRVYRHTTNPKSATGDGIRIARELGAKIKDLSYIQFHPTAFHSKDNEQFLISESVRGEGAYLLNHKHERFMDRYDERLELAPRDVVSKSIILESRRTGSNDFFLDISHKDSSFLKQRFPGIYQGCLNYGVDITKDLIPVFPCQHYLMGGIEVDLDSRTTVPRLYAAGECANTGVHGKNRLASNSLLEALVFSRHAAEDIMRCINNGYAGVTVRPVDLDYSGAPLPEGIGDEIRSIMQRSYFVLPDEASVRRGLRQIEHISRRLKGSKYAITQEFCDVYSMAVTAHIILSEVEEY